MPERISFMSVEFTAATRTELLEAIEAATPERPCPIATVNPEFILNARRIPAFRRALAEMPVCSIDGSGLFIMLRIWMRLRGQRKRLERVPGADLVAELFSRYQDGGRRFYLVGGAPGVSRQAKKRIEQLHPGCLIVGEHDGGRIDVDDLRLDPDLAEDIRSAGPDILLVGFGSPKQELWMRLAVARLKIPVLIGIGGTLDFYVAKKRAPAWMRRSHLEWLYRGFTEKNHFRRLWKAAFLFPLYSLAWMLSSAAKGKLRK